MALTISPNVVARCLVRDVSHVDAMVVSVVWSVTIGCLPPWVVGRRARTSVGSADVKGIVVTIG
jgi:hypothetical protein